MGILCCFCGGAEPHEGPHEQRSSRGTQKQAAHMLVHEGLHKGATTQQVADRLAPVWPITNQPSPWAGLLTQAISTAKYDAAALPVERLLQALSSDLTLSKLGCRILLYDPTLHAVVTLLSVGQRHAHVVPVGSCMPASQLPSVQAALKDTRAPVYGVMVPGRDGSASALPYTDWQAIHETTGATAFAAVQLFRDDSLAGVLLMFDDVKEAASKQASAILHIAQAEAELTDLGAAFSRALFSDQRHCTLVDVAREALHAAAQPGSTLTSILQDLSMHACTLVEQVHAVDLAACAAIVPPGHMPRRMGELALLLLPQHAPCGPHKPVAPCAVHMHGPNMHPDPPRSADHASLVSMSSSRLQYERPLGQSYTGLGQRPLGPPAGTGGAGSTAAHAQMVALRTQDTLLSQISQQAGAGLQGMVVADTHAHLVRRGTATAKDLLSLPRPPNNERRLAFEATFKGAKDDDEAMQSVHTSQPGSPHRVTVTDPRGYMPSSVVVMACPLQHHTDLPQHEMDSPQEPTIGHMNELGDGEQTHYEADPWVTMLGLYLYCSTQLPAKLLAAVQCSVQTFLRLLQPSLVKHLCTPPAATPAPPLPAGGAPAASIHAERCREHALRMRSALAGSTSAPVSIAGPVSRSADLQTLIEAAEVSFRSGKPQTSFISQHFATSRVLGCSLLGSEAGACMHSNAPDAALLCTNEDAPRADSTGSTTQSLFWHGCSHGADWEGAGMVRQNIDGRCMPASSEDRLVSDDGQASAPQGAYWEDADLPECKAPTQDPCHLVSDEFPGGVKDANRPTSLATASSIRSHSTAMGGVKPGLQAESKLQRHRTVSGSLARVPQASAGAAWSFVKSTDAVHPVSTSRLGRSPRSVHSADVVAEDVVPPGQAPSGHGKAPASLPQQRAGLGQQAMPLLRKASLRRWHKQQPAQPSTTGSNGRCSMSQLTSESQRPGGHRLNHGSGKQPWDAAETSTSGHVSAEQQQANLAGAAVSAVIVQMAEVEGPRGMQAQMEAMMKSFTSAMQRQPREHVSLTSADSTCSQPSLQDPLDRPVAPAVGAGQVFGVGARPVQAADHLAAGLGSDAYGTIVQDELSALRLDRLIGYGAGGAVLRATRWGLPCVVKICDYPEEPCEDILDSGTFHANGTVLLQGERTHLHAAVALVEQQRQRVLAEKRLEEANCMVRGALVKAAAELAVSTHLHHCNIVQVLGHFTRVRLRITTDAATGAVLNELIPAHLVDDLDCISSISSFDEPLSAARNGERTTQSISTEKHGTGIGSPRTSGLCMALVLELCDLGGLDQVLVRSQKLGCMEEGRFVPRMKAVLLCLIEMALALKHLHAHNIAHCDVKLANVLAQSCGASTTDPRGFTCKLADFGFAKLLVPGQGLGGRAATLADDICGTAHYMAPEIYFKGSMLDGSLDIYALGICMAVMVTASSPYPGVGPDQIIRAVVKKGLRPHIPCTVPKAYRDLAARCWSADPLTRPSAAVVVQLLSEMLTAL